jgi:competence protein ComEC
MRFSYYKRPLFILLLCWSAAILAFKSHTRSDVSNASFPDAGGLPGFQFSSIPVRLEGRVAQYPVHSGNLRRFAFEVSSVGGAAADSVLMAYARDLGGASYGDRVAFTAALGAPFNYSIPGNLDWRSYLAERGIRAEARGDRLEIIKKAPFPVSAAAEFRERALAVFEKNFPPDQAAILSGIVLGENKSISDELRSAFQDSGAMHLLVASGSNVGFITFLVYFLCSKLGVRKRYSGLLALACAGFYVLVAGLEAPLVRGYVMFSAALAGYLLDRDSGVFQGLIIACLAILIVEPLALFDAGFQMSFIASYGITVGMTLWDGLIRLKGPALAVARILLVSFFAQAGLYALMALYFHKVSLISIFSNVLLVPASGVIMGLGFAALPAALSGCPAALFGTVKIITGCGLAVFIWLIKAFASVKYASVLVSPPSMPALALFFAFVFIVLHAPLLGFGRARLYALAAVPLLALFISGFMPGLSAVSAFSDSDTHTVIIRNGKKGLFLFNPGISGGKLANAVLYYGFREVEGVFISALDRRDWSGLEELAGLVKIKKIVLPYGVLPQELEAALHRLSAGGVLIERAWPLDKLIFGGLEVTPDWIYDKHLEYKPAGYTGLGLREGLDWILKAPGFKIMLYADVSRMVVDSEADPASGSVIENRHGETVEIKL